MSAGKSFNLGKGIWIPATAIMLIRHHGMAGKQSNYNEWEIVLYNSSSFKLSATNQNLDSKNLEIINDLKDYFGITE